MDETSTPVASMRYLNRSAVKSHALEVSKTKRAGKFTRVSEEFIDDVQAETERILRAVIAQHQPAGGEAGVLPEAGAQFITGAFIGKARDIFNALVPRVIESKVRRHPSIGCTLKK